jgi:hypothetical protein
MMSTKTVKGTVEAQKIQKCDVVIDSEGAERKLKSGIEKNVFFVLVVSL